MMPWLLLLVIALIFVWLSRQLKSTDEAFALTLYLAGCLTASWGLAITPSFSPLMLAILVLGWLQLGSARNQAKDDL